MHIGITDFGASTWTGGSNFTRLVARVLSGEKSVRTTLLGESASLKDVRTVSLKSYYRPPGRIEGFLRQSLGKPAPSTLELAVAAEQIDVILPLVDLAIQPACAIVGWIPDFQHISAPHFFSEAEIAARNARCLKLAERSQRVLFSSHDAKSTYEKLFPAFASKARVAPFPSTLALDPLPLLTNVRKTFDLPESFVVVPNQFWRHKNHLGVIRALRILKDRGTPVHCAFTGLLHDARDPGNDYLSQVLQSISAEGVREHVSLLGFVSREDLISLMRTAALVLQPSFSEGWSTSVQDAKALGRPVLCSDLPVHREQAPAALGFFSPADPGDLADKLAAVFPGLPAGPAESSEAASLARETQTISTYRETLLAICSEAVTEKK